MKKLFLLLVAVCSATVMQAQTIENVTYIDANGEEQTCPRATIVRGSSEKVTWTAGWYVVETPIVSIDCGVVCSGDVHLILMDYIKLTVKTTETLAGIQVSGEGNSLTIYGDIYQSGELIVDGGSHSAGIGGGNKENGSNITINGGKVTATGGYYGAGIGGGYQGNGSNITINGGTVKSTGGGGAAGIGGGYQGNGSNITINGGAVTASSGLEGAGIGGGRESNGFNITINGGKVIANGEYGSAGIGSGNVCKTVSHDIFVADNVKVIAGEAIIEHESISDDIASKLVGKGNVTTIDLAPFLKAIDDAVGDSEDATILEIANAAKTSIHEQTTTDAAKAISDLAVAKMNALKAILPLIGDDANVRNTEFISDIIESIISATDKNVINTKKTQAVYDIPLFLKGFSSAFGTMGTKQDGPAVEIVGKDGKAIKLFNIEKVKFGKEDE